MNKFFTLLFFFCAALFAAPGASAQTAAELERVLELPAVSYGDAARVVLGAAGAALPETAERPAEGAYQFAADRGWLPKKAAADAPATLGGISLLVMRIFNIKGGFMYALFPGPRYAYRELTHRKIITGRAWSTMTVSGERLLRILDRALDYAGDAVSLPAETVPVIPAAEAPAALVREERERVAEIIHTELEEKHVADTEVRATDEGVTISLNNIQFLPDSTELMETEKQKLRDIAAILEKFPGRKILVAGHTALAGTAKGRMQVSTDRARAVANYLTVIGSRKRNEITVRGYGAERPLGDPATEAGQALNRRVEITLLDEGSGNE
jgi:outer membrane protein OmpA-like peptidoglycan-associated protein